MDIQHCLLDQVAQSKKMILNKQLITISALKALLISLTLRYKLEHKHFNFQTD